MAGILKNNRLREYSQAALNSAVVRHKNGGMSVRKAAKDNGIPYPTFRRYLLEPEKEQMGRLTKFDECEEDAIVRILMYFSETNLPLGKAHVEQFICKLAIEKGLDPRVSDRWLRGFLKRNPAVVLRLATNLDRKKAVEWNVKNCEGYIDIMTTLHERGYLDDPRGIFNMDESSFKLGHESTFVFARKGAKQVKSMSEGTTRDQLSVLFRGDATGQMLRPCVLYDGKLHLQSMHDGTENRIHVAVNESGMMDPFVFKKYSEEELFPKLNVVFFDGHYSHCTSNSQLLETCSEHNKTSDKQLHLVCLPSGQTDKLQPLDSCSFRGVKDKFRRYKDYYCVMDSDFEMTRHTFSKHMATLCTPNADPHSFDFARSLPSGFRDTGIFPSSPEILRDSVIKPIEVLDFSEYSAPMAIIAYILRNSMQLGEEKTKACLEAIANIASDHQYLAKTIRVAAEKSIIAPKPKKTRRLKDQRLALDKGVLYLESEFVSVMRDIVAAKKAAAKESGKEALRAEKIPPGAVQAKKPSTRKKKPAEEASTSPQEMA